jgi:hypothetical protein
MSISVLCIPMRVKASVWSVSIIFPNLMSSLGGLLTWTLIGGFCSPAVVGPNWVLDVGMTNTNISFDLILYLKWIGTI